MFHEKKVAVVVPAYNEEKLIAKTIGSIPSFVDHILVVDDASTDNTMKVLSEEICNSRLQIIQHPQNMGVGGAIVTGYMGCIKTGADVVAVMAGDAQMDPSDLPRLLKPIIEGKADYSKGDRLSWGGVFRVMPFVRFVGNHGLSMLTRFTSGYRDVRDSQCGYTAVCSSMLSRISLEDLYTRYGFPNDILAHLHSAGARLAQVRVRPIYEDEKSGISLFTALVRVPYVLFRSYWHRKRRALTRRRSVVAQLPRA